MDRRASLQNVDSVFGPWCLHTVHYPLEVEAWEEAAYVVGSGVAEEGVSLRLLRWTHFEYVLAVDLFGGWQPRAPLECLPATLPSFI